MQDYAETTWVAAKAGVFPTVDGEEEKRLKLAFLQGMHTGRALAIQSAQLDDRPYVEFNNNLREQIAGALGRLGHRAGKISIAKMGNGGIITPS